MTSVEDKKKQYQENLISDVLECIFKYGGDNYLSSIILTGSFGRCEPTFTVDACGNLILKSDVEIGLIYTKSKKQVQELIRKVTSEFTEDLNMMAISEKRVKYANNYNLSLSIPKYKTIFTYDLFNGSKTVWGADFIGAKNIALSTVDIYEAKRLIANRIGELTRLKTIAREDDNKYLEIQWKGKLMLAIVSAWLICEQRYVSSYIGQYQQLENIKEEIKNQLGQDFFEEYHQVFSFLRGNGENFELEDFKLREYVKKIDSIFKTLNINTVKVNSISRKVKYYIKYIKIGMPFGIIGFEKKILQALITQYTEGDVSVMKTAEVWHKVLY